MSEYVEKTTSGASGRGRDEDEYYDPLGDVLQPVGDFLKPVFGFLRLFIGRYLPSTIGWAIVAVGLRLFFVAPGHLVDSSTYLIIAGAIIVAGDRIAAAIREKKP